MKTLPDFSTYFQALWGYAPLPWQVRLMDQLQQKQEPWPDWISLPTGTGKTSCLDIAIYHLATQASKKAAERTAPVRIVFAVNRRIVVDEAFERAKHIADALKTALADEADSLHPIAVNLKELAGKGAELPLETFPLRGATFTDNSWARTPTQPLVITTTLDQLGSRLLFRGYGVSEYARPIHAALLANDALLILDEAHTSQPFSQTLTSIANYRDQGDASIQTPFKAVQLTATPPAEAKDAFDIDDTDLENPVVKTRLEASKPTTLAPVVVAKGDARHSKMAAAFNEQAMQMLAEDINQILIVTNRVATAETTVAKLSSNKEIDAEICLLTGRLRSLDKDALIKHINRWLRPETGIEPPAKPIILVSTQSIEVGADYSFGGGERGGLITELAPLDSLRQRFGRLNRDGKNTYSKAVIVAPQEALDTTAKKPDPLYGDCLPRVWAYLQSIEDLDFGILALKPHLPDSMEPLVAPQADAPILLAPHLDIFCQTSPAPHVEPDPSIYIHGPAKSFPEAHVVIRSDIDETDESGEWLEAVPPIGAEAATLPLYLVKDWLNNPAKATDQGGDIPSLNSTLGKTKDEEVKVTAWRYTKKNSFLIKKSSELRSGDFVVIPANTAIKYLTQLLPTAKKQVKTPWLLDQMELAYLTARDKLTIRVHKGTIDNLSQSLSSDEARSELAQVTESLNLGQRVSEDTTFDAELWKGLMPEIANIIAKNLPDSHILKGLWEQAATISKSQWRVSPIGVTTSGVVFTCYQRMGFTPWPVEPATLGKQGDYGNQRVLLEDHGNDVSKRAESYAECLPEEIRDVLRDAGLWHDLGKLDPRFQAMLHGTNLYAVLSRESLAKSSDGWRSPSVAKSYRETAGLPNGFRHELISTLIVETALNGSDYYDIDLLLHLIASHHGRCRAMAPAVPDPDPEQITCLVGENTVEYLGEDFPLAHFKAGVSNRFWQLNQKFGWWGLPYLETILRLADQQESAQPTTSKSL